MAIRLLGQDDAAVLRAAPLTYSGDHAVAESAPPGFRRFHASRRLDRRDFDGVARDLMGWRMHSKAGLLVHASDETARVGAVVLMRFGLGPLALRIPCRVVEVFDEPDRRGFAYATLPGHPECGEEWFVVDRDADGALRFSVTGVSRPATLLARVAGPVGRAVQDVMTRRYLASLDRL